MTHGNTIPTQVLSLISRPEINACAKLDGTNQGPPLLFRWNRCGADTILRTALDNNGYLPAFLHSSNDNPPPTNMTKQPKRASPVYRTARKCPSWLQAQWPSSITRSAVSPP